MYINYKLVIIIKMLHQKLHKIIFSISIVLLLACLLNMYILIITIIHSNGIASYTQLTQNLILPNNIDPK